jgi:hypothetical protein
VTSIASPLQIRKSASPIALILRYLLEIWILGANRQLGGRTKSFFIEPDPYLAQPNLIAQPASSCGAQLCPGEGRSLIKIGMVYLVHCFIGPVHIHLPIILIPRLDVNGIPPFVSQDPLTPCGYFCSSRQRRETLRIATDGRRGFVSFSDLLYLVCSVPPDSLGSNVAANPSAS